MKCEENGGCPFYRVPDRCHLGGNNFSREIKWRLAYKRCHLDSTNFPIIRAMIAGKWKCGNCVMNFDCPNPSVGIPCKIWQLREKA